MDKDYWKNEAQEKEIAAKETEIGFLATLVSLQDVQLLQMYERGEIDEIQLARAYSEQVELIRENWNELTKLKNRHDFFK